MALEKMNEVVRLKSKWKISIHSSPMAILGSASPWLNVIPRALSIQTAVRLKRAANAIENSPNSPRSFCSFSDRPPRRAMSEKVKVTYDTPLISFLTSPSRLRLIYQWKEPKPLNKYSYSNQDPPYRGSHLRSGFYFTTLIL